MDFVNSHVQHFLFLIFIILANYAALTVHLASILILVFHVLINLFYIIFHVSVHVLYLFLHLLKLINLFVFFNALYIPIFLIQHAIFSVL
jgi:hypothetical protein